MPTRTLDLTICRRIDAALSPSPSVSRPGTARRCEPDLSRRAEREALYDKLQPLIRRLLRQYGGDQPEFREDFLGHMYCEFCRFHSAYDPARGTPLLPYLVRSLGASAYSYSRKHWRQGRREVRLNPGVMGEWFASADPSPEWDREILTSSLLDALPAIIAGLPARQRQVVIWRYYDDLPFQEMADRLGIRPSTARSLLRHGLNALRRKMGASHPDPATGH